MPKNLHFLYFKLLHSAKNSNLPKSFCLWKPIPEAPMSHLQTCIGEHLIRLLDVQSQKFWHCSKFPNFHWKIGRSQYLLWSHGSTDCSDPVNLLSPIVVQNMHISCNFLTQSAHCSVPAAIKKKLIGGYASPVSNASPNFIRNYNT